MMDLPVEQISESQRFSPQLQVEPNTKVMQGYFRSQASLKASQIVRPFASLAEGVEQSVVRKVSGSFISELLFFVNRVDKLTAGDECLSFKSFLFHTKRLRNDLHKERHYDIATTIR